MLGRAPLLLLKSILLARLEKISPRSDDPDLRSHRVYQTADIREQQLWSVLVIEVEYGSCDWRERVFENANRLS